MLNWLKLKLIPTSKLEEEILRRYGNLTDFEVDKEEQKIIIKGLKKVDGLMEYLKATQAKDVIRYFGAQNDDQRNMVKGAFNRTLYLYKLLQVEDKDSKSNTRIGARYSD